MTTKTDVLNIARSQLGVVETPAGSNVQIYGHWYGWNGVAWCAIFVSWVLAHAGVGDQYRNASVAFSLNNARKQGRWTPEFRSGYVACRINNGTDWGPGHTGIVEAVHSDGTITCIEGNTAPLRNVDNGGVTRRRRSRSYWNKNCIRIDYDDAAPLPQPPVQTGPEYVPPALRLSGGYDGRTKQFQQKLSDRGWTITADGYFGPKTHRIVVQFQQEKGLEADCIVGPVTWDSIFNSPVT